MCRYFSCIITKDLKVYWSKSTSAHDELIEHARLEDKKLEGRNFVRIEISPKDNSKVTRNPDDWDYGIDEKITLPEWYEKNVVAAQKACWQAWEESVKFNLVFSGEMREAKHALFWVYGSGRAVVYGSGRAEVYDSGLARVYDSGLARVYDSGLARVHDSGRAVVYGSGRAEVHDSGLAVVYDSGLARVHDSGRAEVHDSGLAMVYDSGRAEVYDSGRAEIESDLAVVISNGKVFVTKECKVVRATKVEAKKA